MVTPIEEARAILDAVRGGADVPGDVIDYALWVTGDLMLTWGLR